MLLLTAWTASSVIAQTPSSTPLRRALVLYSDERLLPANIILDENIRATFAAESSGHIEFYSEFLDVTRFPGDAAQQRQRDFLREKYRERPPDLVIVVGGPALEFLLKFRAALFADVPIVYCVVPAAVLPKEMPDSKIAGIPMLRAATSTLDLGIGGAIPGRDLHLRGSGSLHVSHQPVAVGLARRAIAPAGSHGGALPDDVPGCYRRFLRSATGAHLFCPGEPCSDLRLLRHLPGIWDCRRLDGDL